MAPTLGVECGRLYVQSAYRECTPPGILSQTAFGTSLLVQSKGYPKITRLFNT